MSKTISPQGVRLTKSINHSSILPSIKGKTSPGDETYPLSPQQTRSVSKDGYASADTVETKSPDLIADLKKENTTLRIKVHEMQAHILENSIKVRGVERSPGANAKGMETTLVRANTKLYKLESVLKEKDEKIQQLSYEKRMLENIRKDQARTIETLVNDKNYYLKISQDLQAELNMLKKTTLGNLMEENRSLREQVVVYEKKMKSDRDLIAKQVNTIKLLDEKNTDISRVKGLTLNPLFDSTKRNEIYRNKVLADAGNKADLEEIKALNLAFSSDEVLEKLLEEQEQELEDEELRKAKANGEDVELKEKKIVNWEREYKKIRGIYIETRFEFERIDTRLKEEIGLLAKKLNETEDRLREKTKECEMITNVLDHGKLVNHDLSGTKNSPSNTRKGALKKDNKNHDMPSTVRQEQVTTRDGVKGGIDAMERIKDMVDQAEIKQNDDTEQKASTRKQSEEITETEKLVTLGQFNKEHTFDDRQELEKAGVTRINRISVWADNKSILGIQVKYDTHDGKEHEGPCHLREVVKEKYVKEPWKIGKGDSLSRVRGAVAITHGIIWVEFTTKGGVVTKFGSTEVGKESFDYIFQENEVPILISGSFSQRDRGDKVAKMNLSGLGFMCLKGEKEKGNSKGDKNKGGEEARKEQPKEASQVKGQEGDVKNKKDEKKDDTKKEEAKPKPNEQAGNTKDKKEEKKEETKKEETKSKPNEQAGNTKDKKEEKKEETKKEENKPKPDEQAGNTKDKKKVEEVTVTKEKVNDGEKKDVKKEDGGNKDSVTKPGVNEDKGKQGIMEKKSEPKIETKKPESEVKGNMDNKPVGEKDKAKGLGNK